MAVDEHARHKLHTKLEQTLGPEEAAAMMELVPPVGWADVASKHDLAATKRDLKHEIAELGSALRREMAEYQALTQKEFADVHKGIARLTWSMTIAMLVNALAVVGLALRVGSI